jgi:hypothetical protein
VMACAVKLLVHKTTAVAVPRSKKNRLFSSCCECITLCK